LLESEAHEKIGHIPDSDKSIRLIKKILFVCLLMVFKIFIAKQVPL